MQAHNSSNMALLLNGKTLGGDWPKLENKCTGGWEKFERKWETKKRFIKGAYNGLPNDAILLECIKVCLDEVDQTSLQILLETS